MAVLFALLEHYGSTAKNKIVTQQSGHDFERRKTFAVEAGALARLPDIQRSFLSGAGYGNTPPALLAPCRLDHCFALRAEPAALHTAAVLMHRMIGRPNLPPRLGKPMYYRCTNPAYWLFDRASRDDTGILRRQAASVPRRIFFWLCQKLRCCAFCRLATAKCLRSNPRIVAGPT